MSTKVCCRCKTEKLLEHFYRCASNSDGLAYKCKDCQKEAQAKSDAKRTDEERRQLATKRMAGWRKKNPEKNKAASRRFRDRNIDAVRAKTKKWQEENRDMARASAKRWKQENKEKVAAYAADWIAKNEEHYRKSSIERQKRWREENPEKARELSARMMARRRAAAAQATPSWYDDWFVQEIYSVAALRSEMTGVPHHVDHIVPLRGKRVSGLHWHGNMQVIPWYENISKSNRHWPDMPGSD